MSVFLKFSGKTFTLPREQDLETQLIHFFQNLNIDHHELTFNCNGKPLNRLQNIEIYSTVYAQIPLLGGKGGYGAKLKNQGGKKVRPNDNRFSRDAQGRRIEYQMAQKQYTQFIKKKMEQDEKVNHQRQQFRTMQQTMKEGSSFMKMDKNYNQELQATQTKLTESIRIGREKLLQKYRLQKVHSNVEEKLKKVQNHQEPEQEEKRQRSYDNLIVEKQEEKKDKEIQAMQKPLKKVKTDQPIVAKEKQAEKPAFVLAKDKLKNLFKK